MEKTKEIYTSTHQTSIKVVKELINEILMAGKSNKTADDLFEFKIDLDENSKDIALEKYIKELSKLEAKTFEKKFEHITGWDEKTKAQWEDVINGGFKVDEDEEDDCGYQKYTYELVIKYKGGKEHFPVWDKIFSMFTQGEKDETSIC